MSGHGKCIVDSQSGIDKTLLDLFFDCLVENPEGFVDGVGRVQTHDRDEDGLVSLAEICHSILSDLSCRHGLEINSRRAARRKINKRRYFVCPVGEATKKGVEYICNTI